MLPLVTVFGATGRQGRGLVRAILRDPQRRFRVRAVTRDPDARAARVLARAGAEVLAADLDDLRSVRRAMTHAHAAFCSTATREAIGPEHEIARARTLAAAAAAAGVAHVVWSTAEDTRPDGGRWQVPAWDAKAAANTAFVERDLPTTFLYPAVLYEDVLRIGLDRRADRGFLLRIPLAGALLPAIAAADAGACALGIFAIGEEAIGKAYRVAGERLSGARIAALLAARLGVDVVHAPLTQAMFAARPLSLAAEFAALFRFLHDFAPPAGAAQHDVACARELYGATRRFDAWLRASAPSLRWDTA